MLMGSRAELAGVRDAKVQAVEAQMKEEDMVRAFPGRYTTLKLNLASVPCHRARQAAGPEGLWTCALCQLCKL